MKNTFEESYKYGVKIGEYEACYEIVLNIFKDVFPQSFKNKKVRIKWLSNYELNLLKDLLIKSLRYINDKKKNQQKLEQIEYEILEMLK